MRETAEALDESAGTTLASQLFEALRADILGGRLAPGSRLRMEGLRARYGAGASPLREALSQLVTEGLVLRMDGRGFRVASAAPEELRDLIQARVLAEGAALREAIARGDAAWEEGLLLAHHRLARLPRSLAPDRFLPNPEWDALHRAFHTALIAGCGSRTLVEACAGLHDRATRFRNLSNAHAWPGRDVVTEHRALLEAALARDAELAARLLAAHYRRTADLLLEDGA